MFSSGAVGDEVDRIGAAAVLGEAGVVEVELARVRVHHDILEHRAEALGGRVDLRLGLGREADHLGVAAAFEVEDGGVRPAMLVVADQGAAGVGRQRRLAGAAKGRRRPRCRRSGRYWPSSASA